MRCVGRGCSAGSGSGLSILRDPGRIRGLWAPTVAGALATAGESTLTQTHPSITSHSHSHANPHHRLTQNLTQEPLGVPGPLTTPQPLGSAHTPLACTARHTQKQPGTTDPPRQDPAPTHPPTATRAQLLPALSTMALKTRSSPVWAAHLPRVPTCTPLVTPCSRQESTVCPHPKAKISKTTPQNGTSKKPQPFP